MDATARRRQHGNVHAAAGAGCGNEVRDKVGPVVPGGKLQGERQGWYRSLGEPGEAVALGGELETGGVGLQGADEHRGECLLVEGQSLLVLPHTV